MSLNKEVNLWEQARIYPYENGASSVHGVAASPSLIELPSLKVVEIWYKGHLVVMGGGIVVQKKVAMPEDCGTLVVPRKGGRDGLLTRRNASMSRQHSLRTSYMQYHFRPP
jgi:hypothetical protein